MRLLGGVEERVVSGREGKGRENNREEEISKNEIKEAIRKIKDEKAAGINGIPEEVWKYRGEGLREWA